MPHYIIGLQHGVSTSATHRADRSYIEVVPTGGVRQPAQRLVQATSLVNALLKLSIELGREGLKPRIVSAEEVLKLDVAELNDQMLTDALLGTYVFDGEAVEDYDGMSIRDYSELHVLVGKICLALQESGIAPMNSSSVANGDGWVDYMMIEVFDQPTGTYRAFGSEPEDLAVDRDATGWDAVLSLARGILTDASERGLL